MKINIYVACITQNGRIHNSSPCIDCVSHFEKMLHTIKYLVYTTGYTETKGVSMDKIHFRDYSPTLLTTGHLYRQRLLNT